MILGILCLCMSAVNFGFYFYGNSWKVSLVAAIFSGVVGVLSVVKRLLKLRWRLF